MAQERAQYSLLDSRSGRRVLPDWMYQAAKKAVSNARRTGSPPFPEEIFRRRQLLGAGVEQTAYGFPEDTPFAKLVIKESKRSVPKAAARLIRFVTRQDGFETFFTWPETASIREHNTKVCTDILGDYILPTRYVHGYTSDGSGRSTNYAIQERIRGEELKILMHRNPRALFGNPDIRGQLLDIVWGEKRIFLDLGNAPDLGHGGNIFLVDGRILLNDIAIPGFMAEFATAEFVHPMLRRYVTYWIKRNLRFVSDLESRLQPTRTEITLLEKKFGVTEAAYKARLKSL